MSVHLGAESDKALICQVNDIIQELFCFRMNERDLCIICSTFNQSINQLQCLSSASYFDVKQLVYMLQAYSEIRHYA